MSQTITDVRHRLKRLNEAEPDQMALKLGDMDCEFVLEAYDKAMELLKEIRRTDYAWGNQGMSAGYYPMIDELFKQLGEIE